MKGWRGLERRSLLDDQANLPLHQDDTLPLQKRSRQIGKAEEEKIDAPSRILN
ncbi:MAG TPA: hypothetical protein V6D50_27695 [Chroococcales cyanobacterium]